MPNGTVIMPGYKTTFKNRIKLANEEALKPSFNSRTRDDAGKSFSTELSKNIEHELGHQRTNSNWLIPDDLTNDFLIQNVRKDLFIDDLTKGEMNLTNYYSNPTEFDTRILNLKNDLRENGIVDFHKEPIKPEHIKELLSKKVNTEAEALQLKVFNDPRFKKGFNLNNPADVLLKEEYDAIWEKIYSLNKKSSPYTPSSDAFNLSYFWDEDFLAKLANKLPSLAIPAAVGIGTTYKFKKMEQVNVFHEGIS